MRRLIACSITAVTVLTAWIIGAGSALAYPPTPPSASTAQTELNALTVKAEGSTSGYSRDLFPHWHIVSGTCDTREEVLTRDGTGVTLVARRSSKLGSARCPQRWLGVRRQAEAVAEGADRAGRQYWSRCAPSSGNTRRATRRSLARSATCAAGGPGHRS